MYEGIVERGIDVCDTEYLLALLDLWAIVGALTISLLGRGDLLDLLTLNLNLWIVLALTQHNTTKEEEEKQQRIQDHVFRVYG